MRKSFTASLLLLNGLDNREGRLRPHTKYKLPPIERGSFFSFFRRRPKIKQNHASLTSRRNSDVITFL